MIRENLQKIQQTIPDGVLLLAVSKTKPESDIMEAYEFGCRSFGENKAQEMVGKHEHLPKDIRWHMIGHLQTNKVKYIAPYVTMIEAVDSLKLLCEIDKQASKNERVIDVLLELHIAEEETKYGLTPDALRELMAGGEWRQLQHVRICGLMMMASYVDDEEQIRSEFRLAHSLFDEIKEHYFADAPYFCERSWGMSHDYEIAVEEGSTMVRIGTTIFGPRVY